MRIRNLALTCAFALALGACGYFNSLYNARRQFSEAERQRQRGQEVGARQAYSGSIEKAAKSYRKYPDGRWADDALYLIGRARFRLGEYPAARAAFAELLAKRIEADTRAGAHAYAGAAAVALAAPAAALVHLDSALARLGNDAQLSGLAHLWRARSRAAAGDVPGAWADLEAVTSPNDAEYSAVQLERVTLAIASRDSARTEAAFRLLLTGRDLRRQLDTLNSLATRATAVFGAAVVRAMLAHSASHWADPPRDSLALIRARLAAAAGDTSDGYRELLQVAQRATGPTAAAARVSLVRSRLLTVDQLDQLAAARALLLPAIAHGEAQVLIRTIRMVDVLVQHSATVGQPLALFTAAEIARDELGAPRLARRLFIAYVDIAPQSPWAGKALLAAIAIAPDAAGAAALRTRLAALPANPYTRATRGENALEAYETAEERLARSMIALHAEAVQRAAQQEGAVTRAIAVLDSITAAARTDTLRITCGMMLDTLSLKGVRADSVRTACLRRDTMNVALYLKLDTAQWLPGFAADSVRKPLRGRRTNTNRLPTDSIR
ncbi:MAG: hypothetical protein ACT443_02095 [Gemmatimonadota bacterium]